jgi:GAF domain-containing protein
MQCPRCQQDNPSHAKFCLECGTPLRRTDASGPPRASYADVERDLTESLGQQTATSEILHVIGSSPTDVQPVFETIAQRAKRLCDARECAVFRFDGALIHLTALADITVEWAQALRSAFPRPPGRGSITARAIVTRSVVHVPDVLADSEFDLTEAARTSSIRSVLSVPMLRSGEVIGAITVDRYQPEPFSDNQIALLKTFADQAVIAIENVRLFTELEGRNRDLTATGEILRVISSSPTDVQPVFEAIADSAMRLFDAVGVAVVRYDGELISMAAARGGAPGSAAAATERFRAPHRPITGFPPEHTVLTKTMQHVADVETDPSCSDEFRRHAHERGFRSVLSMPMLRSGDAVGVIVVSRAQPGAFSAAEVELLKTFADQAVIAIENVRLFNETREALEQQTATAEILRVISSSPTDVQPVFDAIAMSATTLCEADLSGLYRFDGELIHFVAQHGRTRDEIDAVQRAFPQPPSHRSATAQAILAAAVVQIADVSEDPELDDSLRMFRTVLSVPLMREGRAHGAIAVARRFVRPFNDKQIELLKTFADQAVIAIENVRLFKELGEKNRALTESHAQVTEALEQQTATSEILRVISRSHTDVQPVFDTIVRSAVRLCEGLFGTLLQFDGELLHHVAQHNYTLEAHETARRMFPARPTRAFGAGRAILERAVVHIPDVEVEPKYQQQALRRAIGWRSGLFVPMLREGAPIGVIVVGRAKAGPFSDNEVELLKTFADQAVIAVENVRLFKELQARTAELTQSVEKLTALGEVSQAVSSTLDVETVLDTIVARATQLAGADGCAISEYDDATEVFHVRATHGIDAALIGTLRAMPLRKGEGTMGRAAETREPTQIADIAVSGAYQSHVRDMLIDAGYRALLSVPLLREEEIIGSLSLLRKVSGEFSLEVIEVLKTFATQSALAIQNARLFREIADKSAQLEAASRHKSEFLANMSHELRTPLNAIIGFSEVLVDRMFGELNEKQDEYLKDIYASGQHLLSLINDILDLSKIEAGRMELEATDFDLPSAIDNALILVRERASRRGIRLGHSVDERLGSIRGDERKVKQVLLNLLSNALKFTPEGGRIDVRATPKDGVAEISVADTGVGIAPEDQEAVFEEFRQVGTADKKVEGTGLGLALSRKFIELHGGRIWVESEVGKGSTFRFTLPMS